MTKSTITTPPAADTPPATDPKPTEAAAFQLFRSTGEEPVQFDICGVRGSRDESGLKVQWRVPADMVERFSRHAHVVGGRVAAVKD